MVSRTQLVSVFLSSMIIVASFSNEVAQGAVIQSTITSKFEGFDHGNIYELQNGQIWKQTEFYIWIYTWIGPKVTIFPDGAGYKMKVDGISHPVKVERIK